MFLPVVVVLLALATADVRCSDWTPLAKHAAGAQVWYREPRTQLNAEDAKTANTTASDETTTEARSTQPAYSSYPVAGTAYDATTNVPTTRNAPEHTADTAFASKSSKTQTNLLMNASDILTTIKTFTTPITTVNTAITHEITTNDDVQTTNEFKDNGRVNEYFANKQENPAVNSTANISQNLLPLPAGADAALVKPTKYHYYPHNQHIYLLPECAIQQVCNAVYVRLNWTQPLCACPSRYRDPCSASLNSDDLHTTELVVYPNAQALTLVKTCEPTADMRICRTPRDWSLLALQNIRTGKSHYLVICRCPDTSILEGPMSHDQPTYASVPGIRVYGMMCVPNSWDQRHSRPLRFIRSPKPDQPEFPWDRVEELIKTTSWD